MHRTVDTKSHRIPQLALGNAFLEHEPYHEVQQMKG